MRSLATLPKAHLHLHLTGSMRPSTVRDLAQIHGIQLLPELGGPSAPLWTAGSERNWACFQGRYDAARTVVRTPADVRRIVVEAAEDDARDGSGWLEIQFDPTSYAPRLGGLESTVEIVLEAAREAEGTHDIGVGLVVAASWARPPIEAEALARLAARYADRGVVGFGLANDERRGVVGDFADAFRIARQAGLLAVPHAGFFAGAWHVEACVRLLGAHRIGHGVTAAQSQGVVGLLADTGTTLEICPTSYEPLGVVDTLAELPLRRLYDAGVPIALGSDDPLLFGTALAGQYTLTRDQLGFSDTDLAQLARFSIGASAAPDETKSQLMAGIDAWLAPSKHSSAKRKQSTP